MIAEFGCNEQPGDDGKRKAAWISTLPAAFKALPDVKAAFYFNKNYQPFTPGQPGSVCSRWKVDTTSLSAQAYESIGMDPYLNPVELDQ